MILWILGIGVLALYLSFIMMKKSALRSIFIAVFGVVMLGALLLITLNDRNHFGMTQKTTTTTQTITSASPSKQLPLLLYQNVGTNGKRQVYIYKHDNKTTHTTADYAVVNRVQQSSSAAAQVTKKRTEWRYSSNFYSVLFGNENDGLFVKQMNTFTIPKTWTTLTTAQAKALAKRLKGLQKPTAAQKAQMQQAIAAQVAAARAKNPTMTAAQQAQLVEQLTAKMHQQAVQDAIAAVKK